jgi:hypothetical protein
VSRDARVFSSVLMVHAAWLILFNDPDFWRRLDKECFCALTSACKLFHEDIPQRVAIMSLFQGKVVKKVSLFRILPLSVHDVMSIRSPVNFLEVVCICTCLPSLSICF